MSFQHVALMGRAGSGKDSAAARLVSRYQFVRVAFADPLKESALRLDPIVGAGKSPSPIQARRADAAHTVLSFGAIQRSCVESASSIFRLAHSSLSG